MTGEEELADSCERCCQGSVRLADCAVPWAGMCNARLWSYLIPSWAFCVASGTAVRRSTFVVSCHCLPVPSLLSILVHLGSLSALSHRSHR